MRVIYNKPRGQRMKHQFNGLDSWSYTDECYSYSDKYSKFMKYDDIDEGVISNQCDCGSIRQAIMILKRSNLPKGIKFKLWHKYDGYEVYIIT